MCVIVIAHRVSGRYPFVVAANRDEEYARPSRSAHFWDDAPEVLGGRDLRHGGSWLSITRGGRFAAVTNLRGGATADARSRGLLVSGFVTSSAAPMAYLRDVAGRAHEYGGFHLIACEIGGELAYLTSGLLSPQTWGPGIYGVSNGPPDEAWPKSTALIAAVERAMRLDDASAVADALLGILAEPGRAARDRGATLLEEIPQEIFVVGERYGTRSSTAIVQHDGGILFVEQNYGPGGVRDGEARQFRFPLSRSA